MIQSAQLFGHYQWMYLILEYRFLSKKDFLDMSNGID